MNMQKELTETEEAKAGAMFASALHLKRDREHKDRWVTDWGTKTDLGLWRVISRMVDEIQMMGMQGK